MNSNFKSLAILISIFTLTFTLVIFNNRNIRPISPAPEYHIPIKEILMPEREYKLTEDILIKEDEVLTISSGAKLYFSKGKKIIAKGGLVMKGETTAPILLTSIDSNGWGGVEISSSEPDIDFLNFPFSQKNLEGLVLMVKNLILEREKIKGEYFQSKLENIILNNVRSEDGTALKIINSNVILEDVRIDTTSMLGLELISSALVAKNIKMKICQSVNFVDAKDSMLFITDSSFQRSCNLKKMEKLGEIFGEGIGLKESKLIISGSKIIGTDDDAIESDNYSMVLSHNNNFDDIGDSSIDSSGNSFMLSLNDHFNSKKSHISLTNSTGLVAKSMFSKNNFPCVLLRNQSETFLFDSPCSAKLDAEFFFDVRECFKHEGQCLKDKRDFHTLEKYVYSVNPKWKSISLEDMISYGGEYKDFMLNYPKNTNDYENYRAFLRRLYFKHFGSSKIVSSAPVKYNWHYDLNEIGEIESISREKFLSYLLKIEESLSE